ncbi:c-type cytochrome [Psychrobacter aquaticus]|uniref:Cytochrome c5 n=1 Tax=Psychrobacter aquaticus CMS 56 TaxID=1354303 RepID=U4T3E9_9GAMM|nr:c-type cytochrome [Psychrobacter aquaticus]ERL55285.1 Cytochrome c5 [Psychrobacter aquaticus CMS 56]
MMNKKQRMNKLTLSAIGVSMLLALSACSGDNATEETAAVNEPAETALVEEAPVAEPEVLISETEAKSTATPVIEEAGQEVTTEPEVLAADAGAKLYESNCKVCHAAGLLDAPKYGDTAAWTARLTKDKETLYMHSVKGFNKMPAQAINGVTEAQVKAAVDYMLASVS